MISIALCDDEDIYLTKYETMMSDYFKSKKLEFEIIKFKSGESLLFNLEDFKNRFQIIVLDVLMGKINGIDTALKIRQNNEDLKIIFLTSSESFVFNAFDANPVNYLIKNKDDDKLVSVLDKVVSKLNTSVSQDNFIYQTKSTHLSLPNSTIMYFEVYQRIISIHRYNMDTYDFYCTLKELEKLIDEKRYVKVFRSFIVNMQYIQKIYNHQVELKDGTLLPISRNLYDEVKQKFANYLNEHI
ncbi:LytR/AlgR family response regulator transcription factor [Acholeplasma hippikon]|uniref:Sensory transduction protein lytR n=1 Tax=Acholeplasma hippikon TaxID=264636 RepID=A0A449BI06_9MOLU|nr:LytTR family DNA-binding domain-containing protein [Acholeplasma hippikon]VEU82088.1 Sensory transduction protein lytR [Acholeplasma hippikon]